MSNLHAHPHTMRKTHAKFQNNGCKTVRGVALTRYGRTDGRTDESMNGRKLACLCIPAKACVTITKGHNSMRNVGGDMVLVLCTSSDDGLCLMMVYT